MRVLEIIAPVLCMLALGLACKKWKVLSGEGIANMKALVTGICLPVAIFHALATAAYSAGTWLLVGIMLIMLVVSFLLGFAMKPLLKGRFQKYLPFMVSVYEGGLMAYPLFASLCGSENLSQIAVLDIAGQFGYDNGSKFAKAFRGIIGVTPNASRAGAERDSCAPGEIAAEP